MGISAAGQFELFQSGGAARSICRALTTPPKLGDLEPVQTLIPVFNSIRSFLAANATGMTRDEAILEELTKLLHAKVHDELRAREGQDLRFFALMSESPASVRARLAELYTESVGPGGNGGRQLLLDEQSCFYAVQTLHHRSILSSERDVIGEAYEALIFPALRGGQGQFFTPKNVAACLASMVEAGRGDRVIDPACGTGGFISEVAKLVGNAGELVGIDKDELLIRLASDSVALRRIPATLVCTNSLLPSGSLPGTAAELLKDRSYEIVVTNPPFGSKIPVVGDDVLSRFDVAYRWAQGRDGRWVRQSSLREAVPPQVLFVELCWKLLKEGGRCGIVLPEGVLGNQSLGYVRQWLAERADILAVVDCPLETFMPSTSTKTVLLIFERREKPARVPVFMAVAARCGHDRRGKPLLTETGEPEDDFPAIAARWTEHRAEIKR